MPELRTTVWCTFTFEALHRWKEAPDGPVSFLRHPHRHRFHVRAEVRVEHEDRAVEFILLQRTLSASVEGQKRRPETEEWSCETWARWLLDTHRLSRVEVSEDGENGAVVETV